ncbi:nucleoside deaminase [Dactylosporangium sp. NPDC051541]|uniref:nucleoside deaminase n=1 Tax=Dactylosporangium sp. NPDC051541 TaxID=3363977 RepID=UPI0037B5CDEE
MTPEEIVGAAIEAGAAGLKVGELPIGAVVLAGDDVIGWAYTRERGHGRRLVHAGLLAMMEADERLGWSDQSEPLRLGVNLEPCVMCLGAAMALGVREVYFGVESPDDGAAGVARTWQPGPGTRWHQAPSVQGGIRRAESREQFRRYVDAASDSPLRDWARTIADLPD